MPALVEDGGHGRGGDELNVVDESEMITTPTSSSRKNRFLQQLGSS